MAAPVTDTVFRELLERMVSARQLSASDAQALAEAPPKNLEAGEEGILRWLAGEYGLSFTNLEEVQIVVAVAARFFLAALGREGSVASVAAALLRLVQLFQPGACSETEFQEHLDNGCPMHGESSLEAVLARHPAGVGRSPRPVPRPGTRRWARPRAPDG
mgnify:CR=1 FL=1